MASQAIDLLWVGIWLLGCITSILIIVAVFTRSIKKWKAERIENTKKEYSTILIGYLTENIRLDKIELFIENHQDSIGLMFELSNELQNNLRGSEKQKIQNLLSLPVFINHYIRLIDSGSDKKVLRGLIFFRELEWLARDHIQKIRPLLNHKERYIVHAAAIAIMASEDFKVRAFALRSLCRNKDVTRLAVYEVLYRFRKRDKEQWLDEGKELTLLITDPALPVSHRTSIAIAMGGMGYYYHARYLLDLLKNTPVNDKNIPFIAGLIESLGMLHHPETILEIQRILLSVNSVLILRASIHALAKIDGKEGIELLFHFLSQKYDLQIQVEAAIHIINIDILSYEWISEKFIPDDANPEIIKQIKAEIGNENFLASV
jgi:hypothetical protein